MPLIAPKGESVEFERCPTGLQSAICVYVVDMGTQLNKGGESKRRVRLIFETEALISEGEYAGKPFMLSSEYSFSMFKSAYLRRDIQNWFGKNLTDEQADGMDLEKLIGQQATLNIVENTSETGKVYSNISAINPANKGAKVKASGVGVPEWIQKRAQEGADRLLNEEFDQRPAGDKGPPVESYEEDAKADALPWDDD